MPSSTPRKLPLVSRLSSGLASPSRSSLPSRRDNGEHTVHTRQSTPRRTRASSPSRKPTDTQSTNHGESGGGKADGEEGIRGTFPRRFIHAGFLVIVGFQCTSSSFSFSVAIRMRPLNTNEGKHKRVWRVLPKLSSITQTTVDGEPLPERTNGRTYFTFDKTFGEKNTTREVYDSVAKGIVYSAVTGLNGTIFACGQTSSGKTYTMQGSGTIAERSAGNGGGIVHMAANDIFQHIQQTTDRIFLVRVSFLEIYNEEIRDLLAPSATKPLSIREDPQRGVFVPSHEEIVTDMGVLLQLLFQGDKARSFASTAMNERSSRSHTIFRITIESREKQASREGCEVEDGELDFDEGRGQDTNGAVLISTLNLVDLAGSESVRHTGATGDRLKEGVMINRRYELSVLVESDIKHDLTIPFYSLLTLSRVIGALASSSRFHVNYRDSKLTRILQPSLEGNARMAIVCCATPSQLYLEETRSTLAFAARAKLVKTNAKVNEVLDDRSLIRRLQKELAANEHLVKEMEGKAASSSKARSMSEKLEQELCESSTLLRKAKDQEEILVKKLESTVLELESTKEAKSSIETEQLRLLSELATAATVLEEESKMKETLTTEIERLRQDLELVQTEASSSRLEMQNLQKQLKECDRTNVSLKGNIERLERSLDETTNNLRLSQVECKNRTEEMLSLCYQLDSSKTKLGELEEEKKTLKEDFELREGELTNSITCLGTEKADLSRQLDQAREHAQGLSEQLQATNKQLRDSEKDTIAKIETLSMENGNMRKEVEAKDASLSEAKSATEKVLQELRETTALLQSLTEREESTANKLNRAIAELESTTEEKSALETEQGRLFAELESSVAKLEEESILKQSLYTENERFRQEFEVIQNELDRACNELLDVKEKLIQSQNNTSNLHSDKERVERTIEEATNDIELARTELVSLRDQRSSSNTRIEELQQTTNKFKEDYELRESELTESIILLENEKADLLHELEGRKEHSQELSQELEATNEQLRDSEKHTIAKIETLSMGNGNLRKEVEATDASLSEATSAIDLAVQELQETTALLQSVKDREESTANKLNRAIAELESTTEEKSALETEQGRLFAELESSVAKLEEESILKQSLYAESERFRQELEVIQNELDKTRNELLDVKEKLIQSQNNTSNLQSDKERVERTIEDATNDLELARTELVSLGDQCSSSNTRIEELQQTTNKSKDELREGELTESIILFENEKADLSRQLEGRKDHSQELSQELEATNKQLRDSEKHTIAKIETLSMENGNLRKEVDKKGKTLPEAELRSKEKQEKQRVRRPLVRLKNGPENVLTTEQDCNVDAGGEVKKTSTGTKAKQDNPRFHNITRSSHKTEKASTQEQAGNVNSDDKDKDDSTDKQAPQEKSKFQEYGCNDGEEEGSNNGGEEETHSNLRRFSSPEKSMEKELNVNSDIKTKDSSMKKPAPQEKGTTSALIFFAVQKAMMETSVFKNGKLYCLGGLPFFVQLPRR